MVVRIFRIHSSVVHRAFIVVIEYALFVIRTQIPAFFTVKEIKSCRVSVIGFFLIFHIVANETYDDLANRTTSNKFPFSKGHIRGACLMVGNAVMMTLLKGNKNRKNTK